MIMSLRILPVDNDYLEQGFVNYGSLTGCALLAPDYQPVKFEIDQLNYSCTIKIYC